MPREKRPEKFIRVTVDLPPHLYEALRRASFESRLSMNEISTRCIREGVSDSGQLADFVTKPKTITYDPSATPGDVIREAKSS